MRLLTNLETARHKLLRIILVGQPELQQLLARKDLRQVDQRITARYHLSPLSRVETARYIRHRLAVAGLQDDLFTSAALNLVHYLTHGVPRMINTVCERALLAIFITDSKRVTPHLVWRAMREIKGHHERIRPGRWLMAALFLVSVSAGVWWMLAHETVSTAEVLPRLDRVEGLARIDRTADAGGSGDPEVLVHAASADGGALSGPVVLAGTPATHSHSPHQVDATVQQKYFSLWGVTVGPEVKHVCTQARQFGLRCLRGVVGWEGLMQLNRPVLLLLQSDGSEQPLLVKKAHGDRLLVDPGDREQWVKLSDIEPQWQGHFAMLWRPTLDVALLGMGSSGEGVTWLRTQLSLADGEPLAEITGQDQFDDKLQRRLQSFQRQHGLNADGIAGPWTMILLSNLRCDRVRRHWKLEAEVSLILEALKKAERKHRLGEVPGIGSVPTMEAPMRNRWLIMLLLGVAAAMLLLGIYLGRPVPEQTPTAVQESPGPVSPAGAGAARACTTATRLESMVQTEPAAVPGTERMEVLPPARE